MSRHGAGRLAAVAAAAAVTMTLMGLAAAPASATVYVPGVPAPSGGVNGQVYATLVVGDTIFVGGSFTAAVTAAGASVPRDNLAAFDLGNGALLGSWQADTNGTVRSLASAGGWLYVGGLFTGIGGTTQKYLARVNPATGAVDPGFHPALNGGVLALQLAGAQLFAAGEFNYVGSVKEQFLAELDASSGVLDRPFSAWASGWVDGLAISPDLSTLYVAGDFVTLSGASRTGLGAVDAATGAITGPVFAASIDPMLDLALSPDGSTVYGGSGNWNNTAAAWNVSTGTRLWHVVAGGDIQAIAYYQGEVFFGFHDNYRGDSQTKLLAVNALTGAVDPTFLPTFDRYWGVRAISASASGLVIGGDFTWVSGVRAENWARFPAPPTTSTTTTVVPDNASWSWRYSPGPPPANWADPGFDASAWNTGPAVLGFGSSAVTADIDTYASPASRPLAAYFLDSFPVSAASAVTSLTLTTVADDGVVVYVNGTEVGRANMPSGPVTYQTYASTEVRTANAAPVTFSVPTSLLVSGQNVIAAETHLNYHATPDVSFHLAATLTSSN